MVLLLYLTFLAVRKTITLHRSELKAVMSQQHRRPKLQVPAEERLGGDQDAEDSEAQHLLAGACGRHDYIPAGGNSNDELHKQHLQGSGDAFDGDWDQAASSDGSSAHQLADQDLKRSTARHIAQAGLECCPENRICIPSPVPSGKSDSAAQRLTYWKASSDCCFGLHLCCSKLLSPPLKSIRQGPLLCGTA